jgi:putative alpha-1,2-mannosidase
MSAWYILSVIGFHPVSPVDGIYLIGSPFFDNVTLRLDPRYYNGGTFTILTTNNSAQNPYVQSATLNGKPLDRAWLTHAEIANGETHMLQGSLTVRDSVLPVAGMNGDVKRDAQRIARE